MPPHCDMIGNHVIVTPVDIARDARQLFDANQQAGDGSRFTYLPTSAFDDLKSYEAWLTQMTASSDPMLHTIIDKATNTAVGVAAFMRIDAQNGVIEVGNINFSPALSQTIGATEAMYLMMKRAFDELGYRRYEWKCDDQNTPSRAAATRYGFTCEGTFRNHLVYKGRNRDTAWFSITDDEWPAVKTAFETWLSPENFDEKGNQRKRLQDLRG
ncbi:GNAT family N-acetyltransferase [Thalassospira australica]|uniref:GNAT family N-acetyltransferase n=1 Tax=Thalassospira australica TaxID=1528106 RepID=UPI001EE26763|nr:GNAT family protein [Thalassospira australica]